MRSRFVVAACALWIAASACKKQPEPQPAAGTAPAATRAPLDPAGAPTPAHALGEVAADRAVVLAELQDEQPAPTAAGQAGAAAREFVFGARGGGVAWSEPAGQGYRVFHNGIPGSPYALIAELAMSPNGKRCAYAAQATDGKWRVVLDGRASEPYDAVEAPRFSPDGAHLAFRARSPDGWRLIVDGEARAGPSTGRYLMHAFSGDSARLVYVDEADAQDLGRLVVADLAGARQTVVAPKVAGAILDGDGARLAAAEVTSGGQRVVSVALDHPEARTRGPAAERVAYLSFAPDGAVAYVAERGGERRVVLGDREQPVARGEVIVTVPVVRPGLGGLVVAVVSEGAVTIREFFAKAPAASGKYGGIDELVYAADGRALAFAAERDGKGFVVVNGKEGPTYDRVVSPAFSPDGRFLVYRARKDGKRFVVVADAQGRTIRQHPAYEQVFPVGFTADGGSVAYGVKDGRKLAWKVEPL